MYRTCGGVLSMLGASCWVDAWDAAAMRHSRSWLLCPSSCTVPPTMMSWFRNKLLTWPSATVSESRSTRQATNGEISEAGSISGGATGCVGAAGIDGVAGVVDVAG